MPKLSKKERIRKNAKKILKDNKDRFNPRTYISLLNKLDDTTKIDAIERLYDKINSIKKTDKKNITLSVLNVITTNSKIRNNVLALKAVYSDVLDATLKQNTRDLLLVGDNDKTLTIRRDEKEAKIKSDIFYTFFYKDTLDEEKDNIYITQNLKLDSKTIRQAYKQGTTNCVLKPILDWAEYRMGEAQTEATFNKYLSKKNMCIKLEKQYHESGVADDDLQSICDKLQVNIILSRPFQREHTTYKSSKRALNTFDLVNVRQDHVELNKIVNNNPIKILLEEMIDLHNQLINDDEYFIYKKSFNGAPRQITTIDAKYILTSEYNDFISNFEEKTGINNCKICWINDKQLSDYVRSGCHFNMTAVFKEDYNVEDVNLMDQKRAYCNVYKCNFYKGYLGKITDMRKTDKMVGIGIYTIRNIKLVGIIKELNSKMNIYRENCSYPSVELEFLKSLGCDFDIIYGCWGSHLDFKMDYEDEPMWNEKHEDVKNYARYIGCLAHKSITDAFYMKCDKEFATAIANNNYTYNEFNKECKVEYPKQYSNHASHISAFVCSYVRINTLEQLITMDINDIVRVVCDGIYHTNKYECLNNFRPEDKQIPKDYFINEYICPYESVIDDVDFREHNLKELHNGAGGCGKTHKQLLDKGLQKVCYLAPSWKLATNKKNDYNCKSKVWHSAYCSDPNEYKKILRNYNTLIIDEVSMMSEDIKQLIFERFNSCKLIFCGDIGFQLPAINTIKFKTTGFDKIIVYDENYRIEKGDKLLEHINKIRSLMSNNINIRDYVIDNFNKIDTITDYKVEDMILTYTNESKNEWTEMYKNLEKYYVIQRGDGYNKGDIIFNNIGTNCELRHGFTTHSIQGETAYHNLYIDMKNMYQNELLYTALSRAKRFNQIYLINV